MLGVAAATLPAAPDPVAQSSRNGLDADVESVRVERVQKSLPGATGTPPVSVARSLSVGSRGADVADWQRDVNRLRAAGTVDTRLLSIDGVFGPATRAGTLAVQERAGITRDGVVGPVTRRSAARLLAG